MSGGKDDVVLRTTSEVDLGIDGLEAPVLIGQGGFGAVYRAEQRALGRTVAVKILSAPGLDDRTRDRFTRECMAIGALSGHPHIVTVFDSGINGWGRPYIVMDYMARGSIADRVALEGALAWPEAADMGIKLCGAVASAHAVGILHRDIKPQNVLISAYGEPKLGDFGISSIGGEQTSSGSITASLEHAAPELLDAATATTATDIYALASTIYTMVAGEPPFPRGSGEPIQSMITKILTKSVPDLRPRGVPGALCDVLERALSKSPDDRYDSVHEFADALREVQEQQGLAATKVVDAAPVGAFEVLDRFAPGSTGTTAPTRARVRNAYVPPAAPPAAPPPWKRPLFVGAMVMALFAIAATAFAVTRPGDESHRTTASVGLVSKPIPADEDTLKPRAREKQEEGGKKKRSQKAKRSKRQRRLRTSGGRVAAVPAPLPDSAGSSASQSHTTSRAPTGGGAGSKRKSEPKQEPKPSYPPAPDVWLYHVWDGKDHVATINPSAYPGYKRRAEGLVYDYSEKGTTPITVAEGTVYIFIERMGETEPDVSRDQLFKMTKGGEYFYTSDESTRANYIYTWQWSGSGTIGHIGEL